MRWILLPFLIVTTASAADEAADRSSLGNPIANYFAHWFDRVDATMAEQPHWPSPVVTATPRLMQLFRYDISWQSLKGGHDLVNVGYGKGLEFIPSEHIQFVVGIPPYETVNTRPTKSGFGDQSFLMKYRFLSANEQQGNYILTGFMGLTVPNGGHSFTTHHYVYSPTIAGGKGFGNFDIWGTAGFNIPDNAGDRTSAGLSVPANLVMQYRVGKYFWPDLEANYTYWASGTREGINQLFITPGFVLGNFHVRGRVALMFGAGCQMAVTHNPVYHRNVIFTSRLVF